MGFAAQRNAVGSGQFCPGVEGGNGCGQVVFVVTSAAGTYIHNGNAQILGSGKGLGQPLFIQRGNLHGKELQSQFLGSGFDRGSRSFPVIQIQMLAHSADGGQFYAVIAGQLYGFHSFPYGELFKQNGIDAKLQHIGTPFRYLL